MHIAILYIYIYIYMYMQRSTVRYGTVCTVCTDRTIYTVQYAQYVKYVQCAVCTLCTVCTICTTKYAKYIRNLHKYYQILTKTTTLAKACRFPRKQEHVASLESRTQGSGVPIYIQIPSILTNIDWYTLLILWIPIILIAYRLPTDCLSTALDAYNGCGYY